MLFFKSFNLFLLCYYFSIFISSIAKGNELPNTIEEYVQQIRPYIIDSNKKQNLDNKYNLPANLKPFEVSSKGNELIYHLTNPQVAGIKSSITKFGKLMSITQSLITCKEQFINDFFKKGWKIKYALYDLKKKF